VNRFRWLVQSTEKDFSKTSSIRSAAADHRGWPLRCPARAGSAGASAKAGVVDLPRLGELGDRGVAAAFQQPLSAVGARRALMRVLSTRGRGAHAAPSGATTSFRPPRLRSVRGTRTVRVRPSVARDRRRRCRSGLRRCPAEAASRAPSPPLRGRCVPLRRL
jgi:hypothetical protein